MSVSIQNEPPEKVSQVKSKQLKRASNTSTNCSTMYENNFYHPTIGRVGLEQLDFCLQEDQNVQMAK